MNRSECGTVSRVSGARHARDEAARGISPPRVHERTDALRRRVSAARTADLPSVPHRSGRGDDGPPLHRLLPDAGRPRSAVRVHHPPAAAIPAVVLSCLPDDGHDPRPRLQHGHQFHDDDDLAGVWGREHDELLLANGRAHDGKLSRRCGRSRDRHRVHPRVLTRAIGGSRQLLGRCHTRVALGAPARCTRRRDCSGLAGRADELQPLHRGDEPRASDAGDRAGSRRRAGDHQESRHQRRRILQCQRRASLREPDAAHQLSWRCWQSCSCRRPSPTRLAGWSASHDKDGCCTRVMVVLFVAGIGAVDWSETHEGAHRRLGSTAQGPVVVRRQHGRQGGAIRRRRIDAHGRGDVECGDRILQRDGRQLHGSRRGRAAPQSAARRDCVRRAGHRCVEPGDVGAGRRISRRVDGRTHAGIPRQANRDRAKPS